MTKKTDAASEVTMEEIWNAAEKAGFDHMGEFPKKNAKGFHINRCKDISDDLSAMAKVLVNLENQLLKLNFVKKVWDRDNLSFQYSNRSLVVSFDMSRKGVYLSADYN